MGVLFITIDSTSNDSARHLRMYNSIRQALGGDSDST
jgi:hypothetical protein